MAERSYPSYLMYRDNKQQWRWTYEASNGRTIAVSSESYHNKADCRRSIDIVRGSGTAGVWELP